MSHYPYGGSTADRTLACPGWRVLASTVPPTPESDAAARGTALHEVCERMLRDSKYEPQPDDVADNGYVLTAEDIEDVYTALGDLDQLFDDFEIDTVWPELKLEIDAQTGGTADIVAVGPNTILLADFKFGYKPVSVDSGQVKFYFWALQENYPDLFKGRQLVAAIIQPAHGTSDGPVFHDELEAFVTQFRKAQASPTTYQSGPHCTFCPAAGICPAAKDTAKRALRLHPGAEAELVEALALVDEVEAWAKEVKNFAHKQMETGVHVPGWKIVAKRATRKWGNTDEVERLASDMQLPAFKQTLLSPAQLQKVVDDFEPFAKLVVSVSSGTTLAKESDPRPAVNNDLPDKLKTVLETA